MTTTVIKIRSERRGEHVHQHVFVGSDREHLAHSGELVMNVGEWQIFGTTLLLGQDFIRAQRASRGQSPDVELVLEGDEQVVEAAPV